MMPIQTINPATGQVTASFTENTTDESQSIISNAAAAFAHWRQTGFSERSVCMKKAAQILRSRKDDFAAIITGEMGKPVKQSVGEVEKCAWICDYYAENAEKMLAEEIVATDAPESYISFEPLGVIFAIMPWNFPFWQVFRFAVPSLMAGNTAVLKHASNVPQCALAIEKIFLEAGFFPGTFRSLLIGPGQVENVIRHPDIKAVTLTGSEAAGSQVAALAGKYLKKTVMELGGSDPFIVLEDADLEAAARTAVSARIQNNGQSCIAAKRWIAVSTVYKKFESRCVEIMKGLKVGDPMDPQNDIGPLAREDLLADFESKINTSAAQGARVLCGGKRILGRGYYYQPTILAGVRKGMPAYDEELFGPAAALIEAKNTEDAVRIANDTKYGLGASLWTGDMDKARKIAGSIQSGAVFINSMVKSDPRLPFGGIKSSGYGRELSEYGIKEFVNIKTVWRS